jgi:hypothetical protein
MPKDLFHVKTHVGSPQCWLKQYVLRAVMHLPDLVQEIQASWSNKVATNTQIIPLASVYK